MIDAKTVFLAILWLFTLVLPPVVVLALPVEAQSIIAGYVAAATQVVRLDPDHRRARARRALAADLSVPARQREAAHLDLDGVRDVDVRAAHDRHQVEGELAALDLGLAQVDLVAAHDRDGVDAADRAEPAAPVRAGHDGDHPAHRLLGPGRSGLRLAPLLGEVADQRGELAARLRGQGPAGSLLQLVQGEPADGGVIAERPQRGVALGVRSAASRSASETRRDWSGSLTTGPLQSRRTAQ